MDGIEKVCKAITALTPNQRDKPDKPSSFPIRMSTIAASIMQRILADGTGDAKCHDRPKSSMILASSAVLLHSAVERSVDCYDAAVRFFNGLYGIRLPNTGVRWHADGRAAFFLIQAGTGITAIDAKFSVAAALTISAAVCTDVDKSIVDGFNNNNNNNPNGIRNYLQAGHRLLKLFVRSQQMATDLNKLTDESKRTAVEDTYNAELVQNGVPSFAWTDGMTMHFATRYAPTDVIRTAVVSVLRMAVSAAKSTDTKTDMKKTDDDDETIAIGVLQSTIDLLHACAGSPPPWISKVTSRADVIIRKPNGYASMAWFQRSFDGAAASFLSDDQRSVLLTEIADNDRILVGLKQSDAQIAVMSKPVVTVSADKRLRLPPRIVSNRSPFTGSVASASSSPSKPFSVSAIAAKRLRDATPSPPPVSASAPASVLTSMAVVAALDRPSKRPNVADFLPELPSITAAAASELISGDVLAVDERSIPIDDLPMPPDFLTDMADLPVTGGLRTPPKPASVDGHAVLPVTNPIPAVDTAANTGPKSSGLNAGRTSVWKDPPPARKFLSGSIVDAIIGRRATEWQTLTNVPTTANDIARCVELHIFGGRSSSDTSAFQTADDDARIRPDVLKSIDDWMSAFVCYGIIRTRDGLLTAPKLRGIFVKVIRWLLLQFSCCLTPSIVGAGCMTMVYLADSDCTDDIDDYRKLTDVFVARERNNQIDDRNLSESRFVGHPFMRVQPAPVLADKTLDRYGWSSTLMLFIINTTRLFDNDSDVQTTTKTDRYHQDYRLPSTGRYRWYELGVLVAQRILGMMLLELTDATNMPQSKLLMLPMKADALARVDARVEQLYTKYKLPIPPNRVLPSLSTTPVKKTAGSKSDGDVLSVPTTGNNNNNNNDEAIRVVQRVVARFIGAARERSRFEEFFRRISQRLASSVDANDVVGPFTSVSSSSSSTSDSKSSASDWTAACTSADDERFDAIYWSVALTESIRSATSSTIEDKSDRTIGDIVRAVQNYKIYDAGFNKHRKIACETDAVDDATERLAFEVATVAICRHKLERLDVAASKLLADIPIPRPVFTASTVSD